MLGILIKYECPSCGMEHRDTQPLLVAKNTGTCKFNGPSFKCSCGKKSGFNITSIEDCELVIKPKEGIYNDNSN